MRAKKYYLYSERVIFKRWLPATEEFFSPDKRNNDGLQGICKKCDLSRKNTVK